MKISQHIHWLIYLLGFSVLSNSCAQEFSNDVIHGRTSDSVTVDLHNALASHELVNLVRSYYAELGTMNQVIVLSIDSIDKNLTISNNGCIQWLSYSHYESGTTDSLLRTMNSPTIEKIRQKSRYAQVGTRLLLVITSDQIQPFIRDAGFTLSEQDVKNRGFACSHSIIIEPKVIHIPLDSIKPTQGVR